MKKTSEGKPSLRVIEGYKGPPLPRGPKPSGNEPFILPRAQIPRANPPLYYVWMGLTARQVQLAFHCAIGSHLDELAASMQRVMDATQEYEEAITEERQVLLAALLTRYPAAARRIMKRLQRTST